MTQEEIIKEITKSIETAVSELISDVSVIEKKVINTIIDLSKELIIPARTDADISKNISVANRIKDQVNEIIFSPNYERKLKSFLSVFDDLDSLLEKYFKIINKKFSPANILSKIKTAHINLTVDQLTENGVNANISNEVKDTLMRNLANAVGYAEITEQIRMKFTGKLLRYIDTIATDSLNTYAATYMQLVIEDLDLKWFRYAGSLKETSREWCIKLIGAKQQGMKYIHISQFDKLADGYILGKRVKISKKTGLPLGFKVGTNANNLFVNRGGWACGHQFYPVSEAVVPQDLIEKFS